MSDHEIVIIIGALWLTHFAIDNIWNHTVQKRLEELERLAGLR